MIRNRRVMATLVMKRLIANRETNTGAVLAVGNCLKRLERPRQS
jgi:hypothetical protein